MSLQTESKNNESQLLSDKKLAAIANDLYIDLRRQGMRPKEVIVMTSHLLGNVLTSMAAKESAAEAASESSS